MVAAKWNARDKNNWPKWDLIFNIIIDSITCKQFGEQIIAGAGTTYEVKVNKTQLILLRAWIGPIFFNSIVVSKA